MASTKSNLFQFNQSKDYPVTVFYIQLGNMFMRSVQWHWHEELEIDLVRSGTAVFQIGEKKYNVSAGNAILLNGHHLHSITSENPEECEILSILFHENFLFDSTESFLYLKYCDGLIHNPSFTGIVFSKDSEKGARTIESIQAILNINLVHAYGYELNTKSHLCNFWLRLLEDEIPTAKGNCLQRDIDEERTKNGILFLQKAYAKPLSLEEIADSIHISKSECCRCFKRSIGLSPFEYLMQYRIYESAVKMQRLTPEAESFSSLSLSVGFHNASYYNKIFKKFLNQTPSQYREMIRASHRDALSPYGIPFTRI